MFSFFRFVLIFLTSFSLVNRKLLGFSMKKLYIHISCRTRGSNYFSHFMMIFFFSTINLRKRERKKFNKVIDIFIKLLLNRLLIGQKTWSILIDCLSPVFSRTKLHKKRIYKYIFSIYWRQLSRFWGKFSSTALVIDTFYVKHCSVLTQN